MEATPTKAKTGKVEMLAPLLLPLLLLLLLPDDDPEEPEGETLLPVLELDIPELDETTLELDEVAMREAMPLAMVD